VQRIQATALGILWNECLKRFTRKLFAEWTSEPTMSVSTMLTKCNELFSAAFEHFNEKKRREVEQNLLQFDVKTALADPDLLAPVELGEKDYISEKEDKNGNKMTGKWEEAEENAEKLDKSSKKAMEENMEKKKVKTEIAENVEKGKVDKSKKPKVAEGQKKLRRKKK